MSKLLNGKIADLADEDLDVEEEDLENSGSSLPMSDTHEAHCQQSSNNTQDGSECA